ncbi:hypothetical protein PISMIDRAFT_690219 [Pisolithus microcarpus 441]|uniref:Uncharacterized protein n=1 Tax=Pisolithus microcarpus 441 TaxID=765257 RepID=A0A0C9Y3C6_9AGAM|nr:hypothetical protein PISMIDRAFT_690219 [Pisolithus microcarpus 441]
MAPNVTCALPSRSKVVSLIISRPSFCDNFLWLSAHYASLGGVLGTRLPCFHFVATSERRKGQKLEFRGCVSRLHGVVTLLAASWFSNLTISL